MTLTANPIYDSVFKFLLEDERAAKILLSALLKQEVRDLSMTSDEHLLNIDEEKMGTDELLLIKRLTLAAASPEIRREMQVEGEILSEIEARDTTIMLKDMMIDWMDSEIKKISTQEQKNKKAEQLKQNVISTIKIIAAQKSIKDTAKILSISERKVQELLTE